VSAWQPAQDRLAKRSPAVAYGFDCAAVAIKARAIRDHRKRIELISSKELHPSGALERGDGLRQAAAAPF
jgi:hypothetical protein